jgi:hypothetical protein
MIVKLVSSGMHSCTPESFPAGWSQCLDQLLDLIAQMKWAVAVDEKK